jgi:hypothetical protein
MVLATTQAKHVKSHKINNNNKNNNNNNTGKTHTTLRDSHAQEGEGEGDLDPTRPCPFLLTNECAAAARAVGWLSFTSGPAL